MPALFSVYNSYTNDSQPQGRYVISAMPSIAFMISSGYEELYAGKKYAYLADIVQVAMAAILGLAVFGYLMPLCY